MDKKMLLIVPTCGHMEYALRTVRSYFKYSPNGYHALVVDDASPDWSQAWWKNQVNTHKLPADRLSLHHFSVRDGLTRSWNMGLRFAKTGGFEYATCGNSDLVFTPGWERAITAALENGYTLVGPTSNTPGRQSPKTQNIATYVKHYIVSDNPKHLTVAAADLWAAKGTEVAVCTINGFCMTAKTEVWWDNAAEDSAVFSTASKYKLVGNEDELQARWKNRETVGVALGSFVFHYRSVTRGRRHCTGAWTRSKDPNKEV